MGRTRASPIVYAPAREFDIHFWLVLCRCWCTLFDDEASILDVASKLIAHAYMEGGSVHHSEKGFDRCWCCSLAAGLSPSFIQCTYTTTYIYIGLQYIYTYIWAYIIQCIYYIADIYWIRWNVYTHLNSYEAERQQSMQREGNLFFGKCWEWYVQHIICIFEKKNIYLFIWLYVYYKSSVMGGGPMGVAWLIGLSLDWCWMLLLDVGGQCKQQRIRWMMMSRCEAGATTPKSFRCRNR